MNRCGECGLFCSCGAMWPSGMCPHSGDRLIEATKQACLLWEKDWRGVDQSDGVAEKLESAGGLKCGSEVETHEGAESEVV